MKKILFGALVMAVAMLTGCNEAQRLADKVAGTWSSAPQMLVNDAGSQATLVETLVFELDSTSAGGNIVISGLVSSTGSMNGSGALVQPFELAASASTTVTGTWKAVDDDEIVLALDVDKIKIDVDPSGLVISGNVLDGSTQSDPEALKPQMAALVQAAIRRQLVARYASMTKLDDVEVKNNGTTLHFEVGKTDYVYTSQAPK